MTSSMRYANQTSNCQAVTIYENCKKNSEIHAIMPYINSITNRSICTPSFKHSSNNNPKKGNMHLKPVTV